MINAEILQNDFPELSNTTTFPISTIEYWIGIGEMMLNQWRWGPSDPSTQSPSVTHNFYDYGLELWTAHNMVVEAEGLATSQQPSGIAGASAIPGAIKGFLNSTSAGDVSVSYGGQSQMMEQGNAGWWNQSVYGQRFYRLAKMVGAGPIYVSPGYSPYPNSLSSGNAWPGVIVIPGWPFT